MPEYFDELHEWVFALLPFVVAFGRKLGNIISDKLAKRWGITLADWIDCYITTRISGFEKRYRKHLFNLHRNFDVKGLSTQNT